MTLQIRSLLRNLLFAIIISVAPVKKLTAEAPAAAPAGRINLLLLGDRTGHHRPEALA
jgi:hypothetical protein